MASTGSMAQELMASAPEWLPFQSVDPTVGLVAGLGVAVALILWDEGTSFSFSLPGSRRRLGLAGVVAILTAVWYKLMVGGVQSLLDQVASDIIGFGLIAGIVLAVLFKMRGR